MEKRFEPMTTAERRKARLSAFFVVLVAGFILTVAYFMLFEFVDTSGDDTFNVVKLAFATFFVLVTLFIVGVNVLDAIRAEKMVRSGTVTLKDVRSSRGRDADSSPQFVVVLDDTECTVDNTAFKKINVGDRIVLTTSRSGNSVLDLKVLESVHRTTDEIGRDVIEPMAPADRRTAFWLLFKSSSWRLIVVGLSLLVPIIVMVVLIGFDMEIVRQPLTRTIFNVSQFAIPILVAFMILRRPFRIAIDIVRGSVLNEVRVIRDVVKSNRRLVGKTGTMSGWGDVTTYTYIDTGEAFLLCSPFPPPVVGKQVVISRLPLSRAILGVYVLE